MLPLRVCIVGAGLTGAATAFFLKKKFKERVCISVLEKSRGVGGRMATSRLPSHQELACDLGLQYISATSDHQERHKRIYDELLLANILQPMQDLPVGFISKGDAMKHFVTPKGSSSVVKYFFEHAGADLQFGHLVDSISLNTDFSALEVHSAHTAYQADVVVVTIPVPQLLKLSGSIASLMDSWRPKLETVQYSSRYALGLFYPDLKDLRLPWSVKYVTDDPCVRYISVDTSKRKADPSLGSSVVVHTSVPFGLKYLEEDSVNTVMPVILGHLSNLVPDLPPTPHRKITRWRYSQVTEPFKGSGGYIVLHEKPTLICSGDGFTGSTFDMCIDSAEAIVSSLLSAKSSI